MKVLLATDGSAHARLAEELVQKLPSVRNAEFIVASVCTPPPIVDGIYDSTLPEGIENIWSQIREQAAKSADEAAQRLRDAGYAATSRVLTGDVSSALLDLIKEEKATLVVVGSRGESVIEGFFLGSTARRMLSYSGATVLVARADQAKSAEETIERLRGSGKPSVTVAYDGSAGADCALDMVLAQGAGSFSKAVAVCAEPLVVLPFGMSPMSMPQTLANLDDERAEAMVGSAVGKLKSIAAEAKGVTRLGRPAGVINEVARDEASDVISIGATRHGFIERFLLGSVSNEVATTAPCSVLVVRPIES